MEDGSLKGSIKKMIPNLRCERGVGIYRLYGQEEADGRLCCRVSSLLKLGASGCGWGRETMLWGGGQGVMKAGQGREGSWEDGGGSCGPSQALGGQGLLGARLSHTCSCSKSMRTLQHLLSSVKEEGLVVWVPPEPMMPAQGKKEARSLPLL